MYNRSYLFRVMVISWLLNPVAPGSEFFVTVLLKRSPVNLNLNLVWMMS